jgi:hypothetical protein
MVQDHAKLISTMGAKRRRHAECVTSLILIKARKSSRAPLALEYVLVNFNE